MNWYYDQGGQRQGPVPESEIDRLLASGAITPNTLVWCEGMANWTPLKDARPAGGGVTESVPEGWIRCTATGRYFPPSQIVYLDGKPYSAEAKAGLVQGVLQSGALPGSGEEGRTGPAWEQRAQLGFFPAIWQTIKGVLLDPSRTFETMKRTGGLGAPLGYSMLLGCAGGYAGLLYNLIFRIDGKTFLPPELRNQPGPFSAGYQTGFVIGWAVGLPLVMVLVAFICSGAWHLSLMICSGARQPFETTFRTACYAMASGSALAIIPMCGSTIGLIWALVALCIGLAKTHEIDTGRAVGAVLLPVGVCCGLYVLVIGAFVGMIFSAQGAHH